MASKKARKKKTAKVSEIAVGTTSQKFAAVKFDPARIVALHKEGKNISQIAIALGYPKNCGQNRTRRVLVAAGLLSA